MTGRELSYAAGTADGPLLGDTIGAAFDRAVAAHPDREALVDVASGRRWTYAEFAVAVDEVALGLLAKGARVGIWAVNCHGMTETSPVSTQTRMDDDLERRTETVGRVLPHLEVKIVDPATGLTVPRGEPGELCTRGYSVMLGYWEEPDRTAEVVDRARWMHTGDLAVMREDGCVRIVGRIKDMIIRGGENVYPREIEEFLHSHPKIADVQVVGVPDDTYGEEILAVVVLSDPEEPLTLQELARYCGGRLSHFKVPRHLRIVDGFPMTVSGKVRKVELRERFTRDGEQAGV